MVGIRSAFVVSTETIPKFPFESRARMVTVDCSPEGPGTILPSTNTNCLAASAQENQPTGEYKLDRWNPAVLPSPAASRRHSPRPSIHCFWWLWMYWRQFSHTYTASSGCPLGQRNCGNFNVWNSRQTGHGSQKYR